MSLNSQQIRLTRVKVSKKIILQKHVSILRSNGIRSEVRHL